MLFPHPRLSELKHPLSKPRVVCFEGTIISYSRYLNELAASDLNKVLAENEVLKKQLTEVKLELQMQKDGYIR